MRSRNTLNKRSSDSDQHKGNFQPTCVIERSIIRSGLSRDSFVRILTQTAFSRLKFWTQTDLERLLLAAETLKLNPLNGDIYAVNSFEQSDKIEIEVESEGPHDLKNPTLPITLVLSIQGWMFMVNSHPQFHGISFQESETQENRLPNWMECTIYRKDRHLPIKIREYMDEVNSMMGAWITHPRRMLRHKCLIQCAKLAFGFPQLMNIETEIDPSTNKSGFLKSHNFENKTGKRAPTKVNSLKTWLSNQQ